MINLHPNSSLITDHYLSEVNDDLTSITDINLLKYQLKDQRKNLFSILESLLKVELSYENIVLRIDYEKLSNQQNQLNSEYNLLKDEYQHLGHACLYLINKTHDLIDERNKYYHQWENNRSLLTPRPDWDKVSNVIDGKMERWKILSMGKSSEELVEVLINEIIHGNQLESVEEQENFQAEGDDLSVLPFLRMTKHTSIFNRRMRRHRTQVLIKDIWSDKIQTARHLRRNMSPLRSPTPDSPSSINIDQVHQTLADHVASYFEKRFNSKTTAVEMGYNLRNACQRYRNSEQINLFWGILSGQIEEMVYHHQMKSISQLLQHFIRMNTYYSQQHESIVPKPRKAIVSEPNSPLIAIANSRYSLASLLSTKTHREVSNHAMTTEQFLESLKLFYPDKTPSQINELFVSAKHDLAYSNQSIEFSQLFIEDDENCFGEFLSTLIKQMKDEKNSYVEQIKQILLGYPLITIVQFCRAVYMIDPKIPQNELYRYIEWVFSVKNFHPSQQIEPLDLEDLLRRLENCACFKH